MAENILIQDVLITWLQLVLRDSMLMETKSMRDGTVKLV